MAAHFHRGSAVVILKRAFQFEGEDGVILKEPYNDLVKSGTKCRRQPCHAPVAAAPNTPAPVSEVSSSGVLKDTQFACCSAQGSLLPAHYLCCIRHQPSTTKLGLGSSSPKQIFCEQAQVKFDSTRCLFCLVVCVTPHKCHTTNPLP